MKKMLHRFTTLLLVLSMLFTLYVPASAASTNEAMSYDTVASLNSSFGTVYYIEHPNERLTRTVWDVLDVVMAGASWAEFFGEPSFANLGWAVLDTVALAPVIPSSAYVRQAGKNLLDPDLLKAAMKSTPGLKEKILKGLRGATKAEKAKVVNELSKFVSKKYVVGKYTFLLDKSTMKHILKRYHPAYWNGTIKAKQD